MILSKDYIGLILGPILFIIILFFVEADGLNYESKCILASTVWMAVWWISECIPIYITALLPIILFPLTGGLDLSATAAAYGHKLVFLFLGGVNERWRIIDACDGELDVSCLRELVVS